MRTTVTISESYLKDIFHYTHTKKMAEAIPVIFEEWIRMKKIEKIKQLQGKLHIEDNLQTLKNHELKKLAGLNE